MDGSGVYIELWTPADMDSPTNDLDIGSERVMEGGLLYRDIIAKKKSINITWSAIEPARKNIIMSMTSSVFFKVRFWDMETSTVKYGEFYRGTGQICKPASGTMWDNIIGDFQVYTVSMQLIER
ncbi:MAG: hypothetical protein RSD95_03850 [Clostridia bacterium]